MDFKKKGRYMQSFKFIIFSAALLLSTQSFAAKEIINRCNVDKNCVKLAEALYYEARGESKKGIIAVGQVIVNRTENPAFEDTVIEVVEKKKFDGSKWVCQFSYICKLMKSESKPKVNKNLSNQMKVIARGVLDGEYPDYSNGADHFISSKINIPSWAEKMTAVSKIGNHLFLDSTKKS